MIGVDHTVKITLLLRRYMLILYARFTFNLIDIVYIVATIRVEPSVLVFLAFISKTVKNECYKPYSGKIFSRSFQKCMGCISLIVYLFRDNSKQSMLQPIHFRKDLLEIFPKMYGLYSIDCLPF